MKKLRSVVALLWAVAFAAAAFYAWSGGTFIGEVQSAVTAAPRYSLLIFLGAYVIRPLLLVPDSLMLVAGSALFGPFVGWIAGYFGENISALIAFSLSRFLGRAWASRSENEFVKKLDAAVSKRGVTTLMFLRLIPIAPFDAINYGAGLTSMPYRTFILGTVIGIIPALTVYVALGSSLSDPRFLAAAFVILVFISIKLYAMRKILPDVYELGLHHHRSN